MAPIRIALIGLTGKVNPNVIGGQWGVQHITALKALPQYRVVAVCNTSVESAARAIKTHDLGPEVRAYGSGADLAADPDVDLVSIVVHVDHHYELALPAIAAGKDLYIEYPVTGRASEVEELARLAREKGVRVAIGAQAVADPVQRQLKKLLREGAVGDVVFTSFQGQIPIVTADGWSHDLKWWLDKDATCNRLTVFLGHSFASIIDALGDFTSVQSTVKTQYKTAKILDDTFTVVDAAHPTTVPDTFLVQGTLASGAVASYTLRTARATADGVGYRWLISGTEGELEFTVKEGVLYQGELSSGQFQLRKWGQEKPEEISVVVDDSEHVASVPETAKNIARLYEAFAQGDEGRYLSVDDSVKLHKLLERVAGEAEWAP